MSALFAEFSAFLERENVNQADFCRFTGFPSTTLNSLRIAADPRQSTVDRLMAALATWRAGDPAQRVAVIQRTPPTAKARPTIQEEWESAAERSSRAFLRALGGARFEDAEPQRFLVDHSRRVPVALSRDPCIKCGTRGDIGCAHQRAFVGEC